MTTPQIRTRRTAVGAALGVVALLSGVVTLAGPAGAVPGFELSRLAGENRYETAAAIARQSFPDADVALLANGQSDDQRTARDERHFPDALAGSYLAGARSAPTLLTSENVLPRATETALADLGVSTVIILGGPAAVSSSQEQQLKDDGYTVQRVQGTDRYATAAAVARAPGQAHVGQVGGRRTAILASGTAFPDALVMGPLSYASKLPLTITDPQRLSNATRSVLSELDIQHVLIAGGTSAVSSGVEDEVKAMGITVRRFNGAGRTDTADLVAEYALANLGFTDERVSLALGQDFPDALVGGPHGGKGRSPILLTADEDVLGTVTKDFLERHADTLASGHIFGGTAAVSAAVEREAEEAGQGEAASPSPSPSGSPSPSPTASASPGPSALSCGFTGATPTFGAATDTPTVTIQPELTNVELAAAPAADNAGTAATGDDFCTAQVRFFFDEPVIGKAPVASRFLLVGFDPATRFAAQKAVVESTGRSVVATFGRANDPTTSADERQSVGGQQLLEMSLAAVDADAVADNSATGNPIGDQPFGPSRQTLLFAPGITRGPDLIGARKETATGLFVFEFDEAAVVVTSTGFHVVTTTNRDVTCTSPSAGGNEVRATCALTAAETPSRAYVDSDSVSDTAQEPTPGTEGDLNVLQSAELDGAGNTNAPDLVSAEFGPIIENADNTVLFTFDVPVFIGDATRFVVYQQDGDEFRSSRATRQTDPNKVLATFAADDEDGDEGVRTPKVAALRNAVGVSILEGAVNEAGTPVSNQEDELAVQNPTMVGVTAGLTTGPDLTAVTLTKAPNATAAYVFDEALVGPISFSSFLLYLDDGRRLTCQEGELSTDLTTVTCRTFTTTVVFAPGPATQEQIQSAVLGVVNDDAVQDSGGQPNPEGAEDTTGGTGAPKS